MKLVSLALLSTISLVHAADAADSISVRVESLAVLPNSQPILYVRVMNAGTSAFHGRVSVKAPDTWRITSTGRDVELASGEMKRLSFSVEGGRETTANAYPIEVSVTGGQCEILHRQNISVASAPYFKPTIDGDPSDWKDAIPVAFQSRGKKTTLSTYWNRRSFSILVAVEEDELDPRGKEDAFDAIQLAIAPGNTRTGKSTSQKATRFEYLLVARSEASGSCYQLAAPGMSLADVVKDRELESLVYDKADLAVSRQNGITYYECSLPFTPMRKSIRPSEGREFFLSVLVHDPGGTGVRDWGEAAGMWESQRNPLAWSRWIGAKWNEKRPLDCRTEWGLCSSRY